MGLPFPDTPRNRKTTRTRTMARKRMPMPETKRIQHAMGLYLEGIRDGNMREALDEHTGDRYTQHSTGVADGKEGFSAFF